MAAEESRSPVEVMSSSSVETRADLTRAWLRAAGAGVITGDIKNEDQLADFLKQASQKREAGEAPDEKLLKTPGWIGSARKEIPDVSKSAVPGGKDIVWGQLKPEEKRALWEKETLAVGITVTGGIYRDIATEMTPKEAELALSQRLLEPNVLTAPDQTAYDALRAIRTQYATLLEAGSEPIEMAPKATTGTPVKDASELKPGADPFLQSLKDQLMTRPGAPSSEIGSLRMIVLQTSGGRMTPEVKEFVQGLTALQSKAEVAENTAREKAEEKYDNRFLNTQVAIERFENYVHYDEKTGKEIVDFPSQYIRAEQWYLDRLLSILRTTGGSTKGISQGNVAWLEFDGALEGLRVFDEELFLRVTHSLKLLHMSSAITGMGGSFDNVTEAADSIDAESSYYSFNWTHKRPFGRTRDDKGNFPGDPDYETPSRINEAGEVAVTFRTIAEFKDYFNNNFRENFSSWTRALALYLDNRGSGPAKKDDWDVKNGFINVGTVRDHKQRFEYCLYGMARNDRCPEYKEFPPTYVQAAIGIAIYQTFNELVNSGHVLEGVNEGEPKISDRGYAVQREWEAGAERLSLKCFSSKDPVTGEGGEFDVFRGPRFFAKYFPTMLEYEAVTLSLEDNAARYYQGARTLKRAYNETHPISGLLKEVPLLEIVREEEPVLQYDKKKGWLPLTHPDGRSVVTETGKIKYTNIQETDDQGNPLFKADGVTPIYKPETRPAQKREWNAKLGVYERIYLANGTPAPLMEHAREWNDSSREMKYLFEKAGGSIAKFSRREVTYNKKTKEWRVRRQSKVATDQGLNKGDKLKPKEAPAKGYVVQKDQTQVRQERIITSENVRELAGPSGKTRKYWEAVKKWDAIRATMGSESGGVYGDPTPENAIKFFTSSRSGMANEKVEPQSAREQWFCDIFKPIFAFRLHRNSWSPEMKELFDNPNDEEHYLPERYNSFADRDAPGHYSTLDPKNNDEDMITIRGHLALLQGHPCELSPNSLAFRDLLRFVGISYKDLLAAK